MVIAAKIGEGDGEAWHREWKALAQRVHMIGQVALAKGHTISAREAFLRTSNYYRAAEFFRRADPVNDPEVLTLSRFSRNTFLKAAALLDGPVEDVRIRMVITPCRHICGRSLPTQALVADSTPGRPKRKAGELLQTMLCL